jgi:CarD family transcriptional regulator
MFQIGDQIVYPMHGAGTIVAIEDREIQGKVQQYYVIKMASNMQVMIPVDKMIQSSVRSVTNKVELEKVLDVFHHEEPDQTLTWKQRFTSNMEKVKSGNMLEGAEVVRDLMIRNEEKKLNSSERQMLYNAKKILVSELGLANGISENQASDLLDEKMLGVIAQVD